MTGNRIWCFEILKACIELKTSMGYLFVKRGWLLHTNIFIQDGAGPFLVLKNYLTLATAIKYKRTICMYERIFLVCSG